MVRFVDDDLSGSEFREVVLNRSRFVGVVMQDAEIDGLVTNLVVNGVEVTGYVQAELDRLHPVRLLIRSDDPDDLREAWDDAARRLGGHARPARVPAVRDARTRPSTASGRRCRRCGTCCSSTTAGSLARCSAAGTRSTRGAWRPTSSRTRTRWASTPARTPALTEVVAARRERDDALTAFLASATPEELARQTTPPDDQGWPPQTGTVARCLRVVLDEEWAHHGFCVRDLDRLDAADGQGLSSSR